ncbi:MAG: electron transport complex subunit RsxE [Candidatus Obscuribacterales bacterium]|nr:electron transport complex subunit RsxE [Steroidobacteraceae bacterium]
MPLVNPNRNVATLLVLSPLLAISDSAINALGFGLVAVLVTVVASIPTSITLNRYNEYGRIAVIVLTVAGVVTSALLLVHAWFYDLYRAIGMYVPLLIGGGLLLSRNAVHAQYTHWTKFVLIGIQSGLWFMAALVLLGAAREAIGRGSLFVGIDSLPGAPPSWLQLTIFSPDLGFVLAILPPGAFIAMGLLFALRNMLVRDKSRRWNHAT